jgi:hypothetical protein
MTAMDKELSWNDAVEKKWSLNQLIVAVPIAASGFAFAYVVGYFFAFDIGSRSSVCQSMRYLHLGLFQLQLAHQSA